MPEIPVEIRNRDDAVNALNQGADFLIEKMGEYRATLKRTENAALILSVGDTLANTAKLMLGGNVDFKQVAGGIKDKGVAWFVRLIANLFGDMLRKATDTQLLTIAGWLRVLADKLEGVVPHESEAETK